MKDIINEIMNNNKLGKVLTQRDLCRLISGRTGKKCPENYIVRFKRDQIGPGYRKVLRAIYKEFVDVDN